MRPFIFRSVSLLALASAAFAASAQTIDTYDANTFYGIQPFGNPDTATYGQTFVAANSVLKSYTSSFQYLSGAEYTFQFYVAAWDTANNRISGPVLYTSGTLTSTAGTQSYTVNTNLGVTTGQTYVAFFSTSTQGSRPDGSMYQAATDSGSYTDGKFVYLNNGTDFGALSTTTWDDFGGTYDASFRAEFASSSAVPGPAAAAAFALGLIRRRRRKA